MKVSRMRSAWAALCIAVLVMSGSAEGASLVTLKAANTEPSYSYDLTIDITNRIYSDSLLNPNSHDYNMMFEEVSSALYSVYGCPTCGTHTFYQGVTAMTFSNKAGSVLVQATLMFFSRQTNSVVIKYLFLQAIDGSNEINGLKINPEFTQVISRSAPVPIVSSTSDPTTTRSTIQVYTYPCETFTSTHHPTAKQFTCDPFLSTSTPTTTTPTTIPTTLPTTTPTTTPTTIPTTHPTTTPTITPNTIPTTTPTTIPTTRPTTTPTTRPKEVIFTW